MHTCKLNELIIRCGLVFVHASEILGWIEFAICIGSPIGGNYSIFKTDQMQCTQPRQFDEMLREMDGKNHASPGHRKITDWALWNLYDYIYQIEYT